MVNHFERQSLRAPSCRASSELLAHKWCCGTWASEINMPRTRHQTKQNALTGTESVMLLSFYRHYALCVCRRNWIASASVRFARAISARNIILESPSYPFVAFSNCSATTQHRFNAPRSLFLQFLCNYWLPAAKVFHNQQTAGGSDSFRAAAGSVAQTSMSHRPVTLQART